MRRREGGVRVEGRELDELRDSGEECWDFEAEFSESASEANALDIEMDKDVVSAISALPHNYKMALLLVDIQGHTYQEVADTLAVPVGTVMSRLYRGRAKIEKALMSYGKRYNYLSRPPRKVRDANIDVETIFGAMPV